MNSEIIELEIAAAREELAHRYGWARAKLLRDAIISADLPGVRQELDRWDRYAVQRRAVP